MKRVCAWCNQYLGETSSDRHGEHAITHGICDTCLNKIFTDKNVDFIPFLNTLSAPVVLIDDNNTYLSANNSALSILKREREQLEQNRTGDIFTCENAHLPGGCGHTDQCGGCQMLQLITDTYEGNNHFDPVPVTITRIQGETRQELNLQLTTEKVNDLVLLKIDKFEPSV